MYVARASWPSSNGKSYQSIYLRESFREGNHVRKRDIANLTHCDPKEIAAIELASVPSTKFSCPKASPWERCGASSRLPGV